MTPEEMHLLGGGGGLSRIMFGSPADKGPRPISHFSPQNLHELGLMGQNGTEP